MESMSASPEVVWPVAWVVAWHATGAVGRVRLGYLGFVWGGQCSGGCSAYRHTYSYTHCHADCLTNVLSITHTP
jgi:hypothetical protein